LFKGVTTDDSVVEGFFPMKFTGVSTAPLRHAAEKFRIQHYSRRHGR
jgi:hypothetical protein